MKLFLKLISFLLVIHVAKAQLLVVDSTGDQPAANPAASALTSVGTITLRSAIQRANANGDASNTINFAIPQADPGYQPATDHWIIQPQTGLPTISLKQMIIDGYTQVLGVTPASPNTNPINQANNAQLKIELRGPGPNVNQLFASGLVFDRANGSKLSGLIINNWAGINANASISARGINVSNSDAVIVEGCFFGVDVTGTKSMPNFNVIFSSCTNCLFGGTTPRARNLISGSYGIQGVLQSSRSMNTTIQGNTFGLDRSGTQVLAGFDTLMTIRGSNDNNLLIGGTTPQARNVIAGGAGTNIFLNTGRSVNVVIQGNYIGTDITGTKGFEENGVGVLASSVLTTTIRNNLISGNSKGIVVGRVRFSLPPATNTLIQNNIIGLDVSGTQALPNRDDGIYLNFALDTVITGNTISANEANGIRVGFARRTTITGNRIGTNFFGTGVLGNGRNGIQLGVMSAANIPAADDVVGGPNETDRNIIAGNKLNGISIQNFAQNETITNNYIGSSITGDEYARPNEQSFGNCEHGIQILCANNNTISNNLIEFNKASGVTIAHNSTHNTLQSNNIHDNKGDGVSVCDSSCNVIGGLATDVCSVTCELGKGNIIRNNCGDGVSITQHCGIAIENAIVANEISGNKGKGIALNKEKCCSK